MRDTIEIKRDDYEDTSNNRNERIPLKRENYREADKKDNRRPKRSNTRKVGIIISFIFIIAGLVWYGVNIGIIPTQFIIQQAGPIVIVILGILILIKSL